MKYLQNGPLSVGGHSAPEKCGGFWAQQIGRNRGKCVNCGEAKDHPNHAVFEIGVDLASGPDKSVYPSCEYCGATGTEFYLVNGFRLACAFGCKGPRT